MAAVGCAILAASICLFASSAQSQMAPDIDLDGIPDDQDNCIVLGGPTFQTDTDGDGFGNACDPDYDQDGFVLGSDIEIFHTLLGIAGSIADHDNDGIVLGSDYGFLLSLFNQFPFAISGLSCADPTHNGIPPCVP